VVCGSGPPRGGRARADELSVRLQDVASTAEVDQMRRADENLEMLAQRLSRLAGSGRRGSVISLLHPADGAAAGHPE
jgi:hypothetical protein